MRNQGYGLIVLGCTEFNRQSTEAKRHITDQLNSFNTLMHQEVRDALKTVQNNGDVRVLLLTGGGPQEDNLKRLAQDLGLQDHVIFTGRVSHGDVQRYYNLVDVLVYPRHSMRLTELVTPLKPLEAMAQGKLFVASDVGGHRELIRNDETGYLFRAGDAADLGRTMARVLDQPEKWDAIRAAGRRFVESERNWRTSVARYRGVFSTLAPAAA